MKMSSAKKEPHQGTLFRFMQGGGDSQKREEEKVRKKELVMVEKRKATQKR
jgi:hypothetical protein